MTTFQELDEALYRVEQADTVLEELSAVRELARVAGATFNRLAREAAPHYTDAELAEALGISRQAANKQFGRYRQS